MVMLNSHSLPALNTGYVTRIGADPEFWLRSSGERGTVRERAMRGTWPGALAIGITLGMQRAFAKQG